MKSLTFYFISPNCILKEVNRKTFANYTTVYWLLGWLLSYLSEVLACCAVPASAFSFVLWAREAAVMGAQPGFWALHLWAAHTGVEMCCFCAGWKPRKDSGTSWFDVICWANERAWSQNSASEAGCWVGMVAVSSFGPRILCLVSWLHVSAQ